MRWEGIISIGLAAQALPPVECTDLPMDNAAFAGFYERAARPLWAYLARVSGDRTLADDLTQETFVRFLTAARPPRLEDGEVASRRYLFRIATNLLRDHWRRPGHASLDEIPEEFLAAADGMADGLETRDRQAVLMPAMAQLRPRDRQILWLAYAEGYSHREIAEITGLGSASIRLLLFRARRKMAHLLGTPQSKAVGISSALSAADQSSTRRSQS